MQRMIYFSAHFGNYDNVLTIQSHPQVRLALNLSQTKLILLPW